MEWGWRVSVAVLHIEYENADWIRRWSEWLTEDLCRDQTALRCTTDCTVLRASREFGVYTVLCCSSTRMYKYFVEHGVHFPVRLCDFERHTLEQCRPRTDNSLQEWSKVGHRPESTQPDSVHLKIKRVASIPMLMPSVILVIAFALRSVWFQCILELRNCYFLSRLKTQDSTISKCEARTSISSERPCNLQSTGNLL